MKPRLVRISEISVLAEKRQSIILKDIPQPIAIIDSKKFEVQGYIDAGDLLNTEQSIQVEENYDGKKTVTIRGGNPEDVVVLFNGVKMNSAYDNIFDFSLLNLDDVQQVEIIKGSNTALYGAEAFSGIINIVPKLYRDYTIRFQQKFGTYALGDWNLQLNHQFFNKLTLSYTHKQAASKRVYSDSANPDSSMKNKVTYHSASVVYDLSEDLKDTTNKNITLMFFRSDQDYENSYFMENSADLNQMLSLSYLGNLWKLNDLNLVGSYQWNDQLQNLFYHGGSVNRRFYNRVLNLNLEKKLKINDFEFLLAYQFENSELDFKNHKTDSQGTAGEITDSQFTRQKHGFASVMKWHVPTESEFFKYTDFDVSYRYDAASNRFRNTSFQQNTNLLQPERLSDKKWKASVLKFSSYFFGANNHLSLKGFLNFGKSVKFPTMYQQISSPSALESTPDETELNLKLESSKSFEIATSISGNRVLNKRYRELELKLNYFRIYYTNKYRMFYLPYIPIAFYDNVPEAEISGIESKVSVGIFKNRAKYIFGFSRYFISDKSAFPFKSDLKFTGDILIDYAGFYFQFHWFKENEQVGFARNVDGQFLEAVLPEYYNIDLHIKKSFKLYNFKFFGNFSVRNLLDDKTELAGLALRDRRFYVTFGVQY